MNAAVLAAQSLSEDQLRAIDFIVLVDHSGSMGETSQRIDGTRLEEVREDCVAVARLAQNYDDDGITLIGFSSGVNVKDGVKADSVVNLFREFPPRGSTNLTDALDAAVKKARSSNKNCIVLVYTDGEPNDQRGVIKVISDAARSMGRPKIGFTFIQVGDDEGATEFLDTLNNHLKGVPDVVACVKAAEAEQLSIEQLAWLAQNA